MLDPSVKHVADARGMSIAAVSHAASETDKKLDRFRQYLITELGQSVPAGMDVVLLGSFGRGEATSESDCDYLVVIEETPHHRDIRRVVDAADLTRAFLKLGEPGRTGTFGEFVTATELFGRIGLESDSNSNTTRRLLLLCESVSVLDAAVAEKIRRKMLDRYLVDYAPEANRTKPIRVPHFLLNDLCRYWRTIGVDFGAKQWRSLSRDWFLRYAKLLTTRKVLFAGTLAVLLTSAAALPDPASTPAPTSQDFYKALVSHLETGLARTPLARLMSLYPTLTAPGQEALADLLDAYDSFLGLLDDPVTRDAMRTGGKGKVPGLDVEATVEDVGQRIQNALLTVFYDEPLLSAATRDFGLF